MGIITLDLGLYGATVVLFHIISVVYLWLGRPVTLASMQDDAYLSLKELTRLLGMDRSHARRYVLKLGVTFHRRRTADSANQLTLAVTRDEAGGILAQRRDQGFLGSGPVLLADVGVFYVIQVVPELDPRRVKLGFAGDLADRLIQHRTAAPTASVLKAWPCRRSWETTAMDALTASGCRFILNEVFECENLDDLLRHGDSFFSLLPEPKSKVPVAEASPYHQARA